MEDKSDISEFENELLYIQEKQAITGAVLNEGQGERELKNIEVILEGESQKFTTTTNERGQFYFPLKSAGLYKVIIKIPFNVFVFMSIFEVQTEHDNDSNKNLGNVLTYEVQLEPNKFSYNEIQIVKSK